MLVLEKASWLYCLIGLRTLDIKTLALKTQLQQNICVKPTGKIGVFTRTTVILYYYYYYDFEKASQVYHLYQINMISFQLPPLFLWGKKKRKSPSVYHILLQLFVTVFQNPTYIRSIFILTISSLIFNFCQFSFVFTLSLSSLLLQ